MWGVQAAMRGVQRWCAMQWTRSLRLRLAGLAAFRSPARVALAWAGALVVLAGLASVADARVRRVAAASTASAPHTTVPAPADFAPPLERPPLDPPIRITATFGEYRAAHFHGGIDFSTGQAVGKPVYAPLSGTIERVRTSGIGFGRNLFLHADDGRTLLFAHLDAFDEPIASYVADAQERSGAYEQDLVPSAGQFRVRAGQRIAWSGQSGVGPAHLHFEVRRDDIALNPLRAGMAVPDDYAPLITRVSIEPLDDTSYVAGSAGIVDVPAGHATSLVALGRFRVWVRGADAIGSGPGRVAPYAFVLRAEPMWVQCRLDSVSWATDMPEVEYVYDRGRGNAVMLWAPANLRPRVISTSVPLQSEAGTLVVRRGMAPLRVMVTAFDRAGNARERVFELRPPDEGASAADTSGRNPRRGAVRAPPFVIAMLPGRNMRVIYRGAPAGSHDVHVETVGAAAVKRAATVRGAEWTAVLPLRAWPGEIGIIASGVSGTGVAWSDSLSSAYVASVVDTLADGASAFHWRFPPGALYEPTLVFADTRGTVVAPAPGLTPASRGYALEPSSVALRYPVQVSVRLDDGMAPEHVGLYSNDSGGWRFVSGAFESTTRRIEGDARRPGRFALFLDAAPPRILLRAPSRKATATPYSHWALEARIVERGSGVDGPLSRFTVDGHPVPSEWDLDAGTLRWRPRARPAAGAHTYDVVATDRAGNVTHASGTFTVR